jgi:hypothetical protein
MPGGASEFGGNGVQKNGVFPPPHVPTPSERLSLLYRTGDESGTTDPDSGEVFSGLVSEATQTARRQAEGVLDKGQEWEKLSQEAAPAIQELAPTESQ